MTANWKKPRNPQSTTKAFFIMDIIAQNELEDKERENEQEMVFSSTQVCAGAALVAFVFFIRFALFGKEVKTSKKTHGVHSCFCENESRASIRMICLQNNHWNGDKYQHNVAR